MILMPFLLPIIAAAIILYAKPTYDLSFYETFMSISMLYVVGILLTIEDFLRKNWGKKVSTKD